MMDEIWVPFVNSSYELYTAFGDIVLHVKSVTLYPGSDA